MKFDRLSEWYEEMKNNEQGGSLNATVLLLWLTAVAIAPYESEGVYYTLKGAIM